MSRSTCTAGKKRKEGGGVLKDVTNGQTTLKKAKVGTAKPGGHHPGHIFGEPFARAD